MRFLDSNPDVGQSADLPYVEAEATFPANGGAAATSVISFPPLPAGSYVKNVSMEILTPFTLVGGNATAVTVQVGDAADPDEYRAATATLIGVAAGKVAAAQSANGVRHNTEFLEIAAYQAIMTFTVTGGSSPVTSELTAGRLRARMYYRTEAPTFRPVSG